MDRGLDTGSDGAEDLADLRSKERERRDGDDSDERQDERVLGEPLSLLPVPVHLVLQSLDDSDCVGWTLSANTPQLRVWTSSAWCTFGRIVWKDSLTSIDFQPRHLEGFRLGVVQILWLLQLLEVTGIHRLLPLAKSEPVCSPIAIGHVNDLSFGSSRQDRTIPRVAVGPWVVQLQLRLILIHA